MNCADVRHEFSAMLDGELTPETRAAVEAHLSECSECLRELDKLKRVDVLYRALPRQYAPDGFEDQVRDSLKPAIIQFRRRERLFKMRGFWPLLAVAATVLVILGGILLQLESQRQRIKVASNPKEVVLPTAMPSSTVVEQNAQGIPEDAKKPLQALGYLGSGKDRKAAASGKSAEPVREITQSVGNLPLGNRADLGRESKLDDSTIISGEKKAKEKQRSWADSDRVTPAPAKPAEQALAEAPAPAQSAPAAADIPAKAQVPVAKEEAKPSSPPVADASRLAAAVESDDRLRKRDEPVETKAKAISTNTIVPTETPMAAGNHSPPTPKMPLPEPPASSSVGISAAPATPAPVRYSKEMDKTGSDKGVSAPSRPAGRVERSAQKHAEVLPREKQIVEGRSFELRENIWVEKGYEGEETITLYQDSAPLRQLTERHSDLSKIAALGERVIFRLEGKWYQIEPVPPDRSGTDK